MELSFGPKQSARQDESNGDIESFPLGTGSEPRERLNGGAGARPSLTGGAFPGGVGGRSTPRKAGALYQVNLRQICRRFVGNCLNKRHPMFLVA